MIKMPELLNPKDLKRELELEKRLNMLKQILRPEDVPKGFELLGGWSTVGAREGIKLVRDSKEKITEIVADFARPHEFCEGSRGGELPVYKIHFSPDGCVRGTSFGTALYDAKAVKVLFSEDKLPLMYASEPIMPHPYLFERKSARGPVALTGELDILIHRRCTLQPNVKMQISNGKVTDVSLAVVLDSNDVDPLYYTLATMGQWALGFKRKAGGTFDMISAMSPSGFPDNTTSTYEKRSDGRWHIVTAGDLGGSSEGVGTWKSIKDFPPFQTRINERIYSD